MNDKILRAKWSMDGATTLSDAARLLREFAEDIEQMEREGWQLANPVEDDYGIMEYAEGQDVGR